MRSNPGIITIALSLIIISIVYFSCSKEGPNDDSQESSAMNLDDLQPGQKFQFILLIGESYYDADNTSFVYTGDTLELEVLGIENDKYILKEALLPSSTVFQISDNSYYWNHPDSVYTNYWYIQNDSLIFEPVDGGPYMRSHLLFHPFGLYGDSGIDLTEFTDAKVTLEGWKTSWPYVENQVELYAEDVELLGNKYDRLNVLIANIPMQVDGNGSTYIYSRQHGLVRTSTYSWWTSQGIGWDRI